MKREYEKPVVEMVDFKLSETIMTGEGGSLGPDLGVSGEGVEDEW